MGSPYSCSGRAGEGAETAVVLVLGLRMEEGEYEGLKRDSEGWNGSRLGKTMGIDDGQRYIASRASSDGTGIPVNLPRAATS